MKKEWLVNVISWVLIALYAPVWYILYGAKELFNRAFERFDKLMP